MRNLFLTFFCLAICATVAFAQDPGNPGKSDILSEESDLVKEQKSKTAKSIAPKGTEVPVKKSKTSTAKKIPGQYIVILNEDQAQFKSFAQQKSSETSRESRAAAAKKHEAAAKKAIIKAAGEMGVSAAEIDQIFTGAQSGFSVKLKNKKSASGWFTKAKSSKSTSEVIEDQEVEISAHSVESVIEGNTAAAWAPQYADYGNWVAGGCNCNGYGKWIWVLDTGIDLNHPDLNVRGGVYARSFVPGENTAEDLHGHGTHVAGISAGKNNSFGAKGIAYNAWVVPVKVLNRYGSGSWSGILAGLNHVYRYGIRGDVVNMSLGGSISASAPPTAVERAIKRLANRGIYVVIAAGNSSKHARGATPARVNGSKIYTIAATQKSPYWWAHRFASNYSNYGKPPVDFAAPGSSIYSTYKNGGYGYMSGTSMAAPNFAGALLCGTKNKKGYYYYKVSPSSHKLYVIRAKN
ncbi:MAG: S8 family serine peptidase [Saprospiraceae bacterium]|nr:S8 family serine peptidase [Saprospiraceae bacterium]